MTYRNAWGADLSGYGEAGDFLAREVFTLAYGDAGPGVGCEMDGTTGFVQKGPYNEPIYDLVANHLAVLYPITCDDRKPAMLWAWQRPTGWNKDQNDFVAQIFLRRGQPGSQNAGAFRIMGVSMPRPVWR